MNGFRDVKNDIMSEWINFREDDICCNLNAEDKSHNIGFDDICTNILRNVPDRNKKYVRNQLELLDDHILDYVCYWNEKYYRCGFCDGVKLIGGCCGK